MPEPLTSRQLTAEELVQAGPGELFRHYAPTLPWLTPYWEPGSEPERSSEREAWIHATGCGGGWTPISQGWTPSDSNGLWLALERTLPLFLDPTVEEIWIQRLLNPQDSATPQGSLDVLSDGLLGVRRHPELRMSEKSLTDAFTKILSQGGKTLYSYRTPHGTPIVESPLECPGVRLAGGAPPLSVAAFAAIRIPARVRPNLNQLDGAVPFSMGYDADLVAPGEPLHIPADDPLEASKKLIAEQGGLKGKVMLPVEALEYLRCVFLAGWNPIFSGATSSAKTTALNAAMSLMPPQWRYVTMEHNVFELKLPHVNWLPLLSNDNLLGEDGKPMLTPDKVLALVLRLSPRPIPVGELRGLEGNGWIRATTTGHEASPTTLHAGDPAEAIQRLTTDMIMPANPGIGINEAKMRACKAANVVVQLAREEILVDGHVVSRRRCVSIHEVHVTGNFVEGGEKATLVPIFQTRETQGEPVLEYVGQGKNALWPLMAKRFMHDRVPTWALPELV